MGSDSVNQHVSGYGGSCVCSPDPLDAEHMTHQQGNSSRQCNRHPERQLLCSRRIPQPADSSIGLCAESKPSMQLVRYGWHASGHSVLPPRCR